MEAGEQRRTAVVTGASSGAEPGTAEEAKS
ncbi:MAG: hypothetical protein QOE75_1834 [Solirubrobacterales bacterium]|jgi:NADP-dependent 3-hydroxy acid dehydrogenase YdfG|nr:hypothetical protein [Solirubrobacterales bacterium]